MLKELYNDLISNDILTENDNFNLSINKNE